MAIVLTLSTLGVFPNVSDVAVAHLGVTAGPSAIAATASPEPAHAFIDVAHDHRFRDAVDWLVTQGITTGVGDRRFAPDATVTRGQMAAFLWRYSWSPAPDEPVRFRDVGPDAWNADAVAFLAVSGVTQGVSDGVFGGAQPITRAQMATFMWRLSGRPATDRAAGFVDVAADDTHASGIAWMAATGVTRGTSPDTFDPSGAVTRGQMAGMLWRHAGEPAPHDPGSGRPAAPAPDPGNDHVDEGDHTAETDGGDGRDPGDPADPGVGAPGPSPSPEPGDDEADPLPVVVDALCDLSEEVRGFVGSPVVPDRGEDDYLLEVDYSLRHGCGFATEDAVRLVMSRWPEARDDPRDRAGHLDLDGPWDLAFVHGASDGGDALLTVQQDGSTLYLRVDRSVADWQTPEGRSALQEFATTIVERTLPFTP